MQRLSNTVGRVVVPELGYLFFLAAEYLSRTTVFFLKDSVSTLRIAAISLTLISVTAARFPAKFMAPLLLYVSAFAISALNSNEFSLAMALVLAIACWGSDLTRLAKISGITALLMTLLAFFATAIGQAQDVVTVRVNGLVRHSYGFEHPNRLGVMLFIMAVSLLIVTFNQTRIRHFAMFAALFTVAYMGPNSRASTAGIVLCVIAAGAGRMVESRMASRLFQLGARVSVTVVILVSVATAVYYDESYLAWRAVNTFLSDRAYLLSYFYSTQPLTSFGSNLSTINTVFSHGAVYEEAVLDNAVWNLLLEQGYIPALLSLLVLMKLLYNKEFTPIPVAGLAAVSVYAFVGLSEAVVLDPSVNICLPCIGAWLVGPSTQGTPPSSYKDEAQEN